MTRTFHIVLLCYVLDRLNADSCIKVHGNFWCEGIKCPSTWTKMLSVNDIFITLILTVFPLTTKMSCHVIHHDTCFHKVIPRPMRILKMLLSCFEFFRLKYFWSEVCSLFVRTLLPQSGKCMECLSHPVPFDLTERN